MLRTSGGEQQRVAIARSLPYNPKMIVADESTGNLDKQTEKDILDIFKKLAHEDGKCVIIVTHSPNVYEMVDQVYDLKKERKEKYEKSKKYYNYVISISMCYFFNRLY